MTGVDVTTAAANGTSDPPVADSPAGSVLNRLRSAAAAERQTRTLDLTVPGENYAGRLVVRYGLLSLDSMDRYAELVDNRVGLTTIGVDMAVNACQTLLWVEDGQTTDLNVGLDGGLAELLDAVPDAMTADDLRPRDVVLALFADNGLAITQHIGDLLDWMAGPTGRAPGESSGRTS